MLDKNQIIDILKQYNFDSNKYIVISGAAMVLLEKKELTNDIDISVTKDYYEYLLNNYHCKLDKVNEAGNKVFLINDIINFSIDYYSKDCVWINDIPIQTIEDIKKLKKHLNREKDKEDLKLL